MYNRTCLLYQKGPSSSWSYGSWIYTTCAISSYHHESCESESRSILYTTLSNKVVSDLQQVGGFLWVLRFPPPINWPPRYNWKIVESGVKHHNSNPNPSTEITKTITYLQYIQGLGLWFLTPLSAIIQLYPGGSIYTRYKENVMIVTSQEDKHYESTEFFLSKLFFAYLSISSGNFITPCLLVEKRLYKFFVLVSKKNTIKKIVIFITDL